MPSCLTKHTGKLRTEQIRGFGYAHDGSVDTLLSFIELTAFKSLGEQTVRDVSEYVLAMNSEHASIVGQQVTVGGQSSSDRTVLDRLHLLHEQAAMPFDRCDLVVTGVVAGKTVGAYMNKHSTFIQHSTLLPEIFLADLLVALENDEDTLTFTCVPLGNGVRIGIDRDLDGVLNGDDTLTN